MPRALLRVPHDVWNNERVQLLLESATMTRDQGTGDRSNLATVVTLGSTIGGSIVGGLLLGIWLDGVAGTSPLLLLLGLLLGIVGAGAALVASGRSSSDEGATHD